MSWRDRDYAREGAGFGGGMGGRLAGASIVTRLLVINVAVFFLDMILIGSSRGNGIAPAYWGAFTIQDGVYGLQIWRWFTYQFIHADFLHILFNMIGLYFFGPMIERWWGSRRFLAFYLLCGMSGAVLFTVLGLIPGVLNVSAKSSLVGASGSLFGILMACAVLYPHQRVMLLIPPIPMSMRTMAFVFMGLALFSVVVGGRNAGGQAAHLGGAALGWLLVKNANVLNFADGLGGLFTGMKRKRMQRFAEEDIRKRQREQEEVNRVLDKVRDKGLQSLTNREKKILQTETDRQRG